MRNHWHGGIVYPLPKAVVDFVFIQIEVEASSMTSGLSRLANLKINILMCLNRQMPTVQTEIIMSIVQL